MNRFFKIVFRIILILVVLIAFGYFLVFLSYLFT